MNNLKSQIELQKLNRIASTDACTTDELFSIRFVEICKEKKIKEIEELCER